MTTEPAPDAPDGTTSAAAATATEGTRTLLRDRDFRYLWAGETTSVLCREIGLLALPVVAVELLRATEFEVGVLNAASMAAFLLVGLPAGAWVDRWLKRRTMIAATWSACSPPSSYPCCGSPATSRSGTCTSWPR